MDENVPLPYQSRRSNACAPLNTDEFDRLVAAAEMYLSSRSVLTSFISTVGNLVERGLSLIPEHLREEIIAKIHEALTAAHGAAMVRMDDEPGRHAQPWTYLGAVIGTGLAGGAAGAAALPALLAELPVTTGLMLRSITDIGRAHGEHLDDPLFRQTCIEVFAYGSPIEDDEDELEFLMVRMGAAGFIAKVAIRYATALGPRIAAMSVPVAGAVAGAALNFAYLTFYQSIARVLFTLLPLERKYDGAMVRSCFAGLVREMRERNNARRHRK
jgi:EcsC protein family